MNVEYRIDGLADLERQLVNLDSKVARPIVRKALKRGGEIVKAAARANVRKDEGLLEKALKVVASGVRFFSGVLVDLSFGPVQALVAGGKDTSQGTMTVKVGTYKPSPVAGSHKKYPGDPFYARFVEAKFPFLRPALDQNAERVVSEVRNQLRVGLEKANSRA